MKMTASLEVGMVVRDLDAMIAFYEEALDMSVEMRFPMDEDLTESFGWERCSCEVAYMRTQHGERIKLCDPPSPAREEPTFGGLQGYSYLTFTVADIDEVAVAIQKAGATSISTPTILGEPGTFPRFGGFRDPEGNAFDLYEPDPDAAPDALASEVADRFTK